MTANKNMVKMAVGDVVAAAQVFADPAYSRKAMDMNISMWFLRNGKVCSEVHTAFTDNRQAIFDEMATEENEENKMVIPEKNLEEYRERLVDLLKQEVEIEVIPIAAEALKDLQIAPLQLKAIVYAIAE